MAVNNLYHILIVYGKHLKYINRYLRIFRCFKAASTQASLLLQLVSDSRYSHGRIGRGRGLEISNSGQIWAKLFKYLRGQLPEYSVAFAQIL